MVSSNRQVTSYAWLVWGLAAFFFFAEYFARVAPTVMVNELVHSLMISATGFGSITACFYWAYIPMQIPVGLLVDRFSVRWLLSAMAFLTAFSCAVFASSIGLAMACFSRLLLGFGAAFAFVGAIKIASMWFPPTMLGLIAGLTQALGMLGAASGELPVAFMVDIVGWRTSLWFMAAAFALLSVLMALLIKDNTIALQQVGKPMTKKHHMFESMSIVLSNPQTWWNAIFSGLLFVPTALLGESWGVEYLKNVHHLSHHQAALANGIIFIGWGMGGPVVGLLSDKIGRRKLVMIVSAVMSFICISILVWGPVLSYRQIILLLFVYGVFNTGVAVSYALATEINPRRDSGMSIAFANMGSIVTGALLLPVVGKAIDWHSRWAMTGPNYTSADFQFAMNILPIALVISFIFLAFVKETYCQPLSE